MGVPGRRTRVVIVGAGFGGLFAARELAGKDVDVVLVDRNNYHTFLPLLYQVAAAELEPEDVAYPIREILRRMRNVRFVMGEVRRIVPSARRVILDVASLAYDHLVLAAGSTSHDFGIPGVSRHAFPLKSIGDGVALRNRVLLAFERAVNEHDPSDRARSLTFAIVGGGPTGVEFSGALSELIRGPLAKDFPTLDMKRVRVVLVEAADGLLAGFPERLRAYARRHLVRRGVEVRLDAAVSAVSQDGLTLRDGTTIPTSVVAWTGGVRGNPVAAAAGLPVARGDRVPVTPTLQAEGFPEVFVVGDLAYLESGGRALPQVAPVALQQGIHAARNILRAARGETMASFRYRDRGSMVTLGRNAAVATLLGRSFTGFPAWVLWLAVHLYKLIGFRNRLSVIVNWAWDYFLFERAVRVMLK